MAPLSSWSRLAAPNCLRGLACFSVADQLRRFLILRPSPLRCIASGFGQISAIRSQFSRLWKEELRSTCRWIPLAIRAKACMHWLGAEEAEGFTAHIPRFRIRYDTEAFLRHKKAVTFVSNRCLPCSTATEL